MILLTERLIVRHGLSEPIERFEVWFMTPLGVTEHLDEAIKRVVGMDMDPASCILPVSVAISATTYEVIGR